MPQVSFMPSITKALQLMDKPADKQLQKSPCGVWQYLELSCVLTNGRRYLSYVCRLYQSVTGSVCKD